MVKYLLTLLLLISSLYTSAQELKRLSSKGIQLAPLSSEQLASMNLTAGMRVHKVIPGFTAAEIGIKDGDVIISINDAVLETPQKLFLPELNLRGGDVIKYEVLRNNEKLTLQGKCIANPIETSEKFNVEYGSFPFENGYIRSIYLKPKDKKKKPAILFIPGYPCSSVDNLWVHHPYKKLIYGLAEKGYLVMRAEKPGVGDCTNTPDCATIDFHTEVASFKAALQELKKHPEVDTNNIFIFGHSMGGIEAPLVASGNSIRGIIAMGITVKPWLEYLTEMLRVQNPNLGMDYLQLEKDMRLYETLLYELLVVKKTPLEMVQKNPDYARILKRDFNYTGGDDFLTRNIIFSQSLNDINMIEAWANTECKVLSAWGETDIQTINDFSHRELVKIVNQYHPGNATFLILEGTDHNFVSFPTMEESYKANREGTLVSMYPTKFNNKVVDEFDKWIRSVMVNK
ncbi:MAG: alpha/beta hydrolase [Cyclobacteriaceae bacterium]|nr:alpha/beta hydrolase [Cyclobacteriaceae bacterium]